MDEKMQKHLRTFELQEKIMECFQTILRCEEELKEIRHDDLYDSGFNTVSIILIAIASNRISNHGAKVIIIN